MKLFMFSMRIRSPAVQEYVSLPCLSILQQIIKPDAPASSKFKVSSSASQTRTRTRRPILPHTETQY